MEHVGGARQVLSRVETGPPEASIEGPVERVIAETAVRMRSSLAACGVGPFLERWAGPGESGIGASSGP
eukprot:5900570-Alexandrium_andersonii.AAC.1